jgi:hypothetical protein
MPAQMLSSVLRTNVVKIILKGADDAYVRQPLWNFPPSYRAHVLHERRVRFGVPTADDFDPEYH